MIKVTIIGSGNVAFHLNAAFAKTNIVQAEMISSRGDLRFEIDQKGQKNQESDIYIIAVSDDAITTVSQHFKKIDSLVVHTSGSVSMNVLSIEKNSGVFYPLQTFSKDRKVDFQSIPICIEAKNNEDLKLLKTLAFAISDSVQVVNSEQRKSLHLAAVYVNNFTNHLYHVGHEICERNKLSFEILKPLIAETANKIVTLYPIDAQTGPAKRKDIETIATQTAQIENENYKKIYEAITTSILNTYEKKL